MKCILLAGGVLLAVACVGVWIAVQSPSFWIGLAVALAPMLVGLGRVSEATIRRNRDDTRRRVDRGADSRERMR